MQFFVQLARVAVNMMVSRETFGMVVAASAAYWRLVFLEASAVPD